MSKDRPQAQRTQSTPPRPDPNEPLSQLPHNAQLESILESYRKTNIKDGRQRQALADSIQASTLPRYHKESLLAILLASTGEEVTLSMQLLRNQEVLRHADALNAIERRLLAERLKKIQNKG